MKKLTPYVWLAFLALSFLFFVIYDEDMKRLSSHELASREAKLKMFYRQIKSFDAVPDSLYELFQYSNFSVMDFIYYYERPRNIIEEPFPKKPTQKEFDQLCQYKLVHLKDGKWYIIELANGYRIKKRFLITNEGTICEADSNQ